MSPRNSTRTESPAAQANREQPFDWAALTVEDAAPPTRKTTRTPQNNPALPSVRDSWEKRDKETGVGGGKVITVPESKAQEFTNYIRYASNFLTDELGEQIGTTIVSEDAGKGMVRIHFAAKKRRRNSRTAAAVTPDTQDDDSDQQDQGQDQDQQNTDQPPTEG
jgi:hypothetical protein